MSLATFEMVDISCSKMDDILMFTPYKYAQHDLGLHQCFIMLSDPST